jgi:hypothetical protein
MPTLEDQCSVVHDHPCLRARCLRWCWRRRKRWRTAARWSSACRCDTPSCAPSSQDQRPAPAARGTGVAAPAEVASCRRPPWLGAKCCALQWSAHLAPRARGAVDRRGGRGRDAAQRGRPVRLGVYHARAAAPLRGRALPHAPRGARLRRQGCAARACAPPLMGSLSPHALAPRRPGPACPPAAGGRAGRLSAAL